MAYNLKYVKLCGLNHETNTKRTNCICLFLILINIYDPRELADRPEAFLSNLSGHKLIMPLYLFSEHTTSYWGHPHVLDSPGEEQ